MIVDLKNDWNTCLQLNMSREVFHGLHLQLQGLFISEKVISDGFRNIYIKLPYSSTANEHVPQKIPLIRKEHANYILENNRIICIQDEHEVAFTSELVTMPLVNDEGRYSKGYSFPFVGTENPYYELRINPKNTGSCPGKCLFCHREISHRRAPLQSVEIIPVEKIIESIVNEHGTDALKRISHVSVITELFGREDVFLDYIDRMKNALVKYSDIDFRACAQDVRTKKGLERLKSIVDDNKYSFTLEIFSNREKIMGRYKGIPLDQVERILYHAKEVGFESIKFNYIAGIDSIDDFNINMYKFRKNKLVDMLGLSIFTAFYHDQASIRHKHGWSAKYYFDMIEVISELGIILYEPSCFDMGFPEPLIEKCKRKESKC